MPSYTLGEETKTDLVFAVDTTPYKEIVANAIAPLSAASAVSKAALEATSTAMASKSIATSTTADSYTVDSLTSLYKRISRAQAYYDEIVTKFSPAEIQAAPMYQKLIDSWKMIQDNLKLIQASKWNPMAASAAVALQKRKLELIEQGNLDPSVFSSEEIAAIKAKATAGHLQFSADPTEQQTMVNKILATADTVGRFTVKQVAIAGAVVLGAYLLLRRR